MAVLKTQNMKSVFFTLASMIFFVSCAQTQSSKPTIPVGSKQASSNEAVATFAEGCFWHSEIVFQSLVGVRDAVSGYAGGTATNPTYEDVSGGTTGHAESVNVYYDPSKISYETLVAAFFASMDPTSLNRQGNDAGTEYRSIAFYRNDKERKIVQAEIDRINTSKKYKSKVVTEVIPFTKFYPAEVYHQEYIVNHPDNPYVQHVSIPDFIEFKRVFKGPFKQ